MPAEAREKEQRVRLRCPNCDHVVATVPRGYRFKDTDLVCPGCGAWVEPPRLGSLLDEIKRTAADLIGRVKRSNG